MNKEGLQTNPRLLGIREQYARARRFLQVARRCKKPTSHFRNLIAAIYPARAIVEIMLEAAEKQELRSYQDKDIKKNRKELGERIAPKLPYYYLLEKIRIHDFHRFGCLPPHPNKRVVFYGGPMKLLASKGAAILQLTSDSPKITTTGASKAKEQRPLYPEDGRFFNDESGECLSLEVILSNFLDAIPELITDFESLLAG